MGVGPFGEHFTGLLYSRGGAMPADVRNMFDRLERLRVEGAKVSKADVAAFRALTAEHVSRQAHRVIAQLHERARIDGQAETLTRDRRRRLGEAAGTAGVDRCGVGS